MTPTNPLPMPVPVPVILLLLLASCSCQTPPKPDPVVEDEPPPECDAGDRAFVQNATLSLLGRRPLSFAEIEEGAAEVAATSRREFALALMDDPAFVDRWSDLLKDQLQVPRAGVQSLGDCYEETLLDDDDEDTRLAEFIADHGAEEEFDSSFSFEDVLRQSLVKDDLSVAWRAHLYALLTRLNGCINLAPVEQELAFRDEVGHTFETAYLNRDPVCLGCHTSSFAVTDDDDPEKDRHWPLRGHFEESVFGAATVDDARVPRGVWRVRGYVDGDGFGPAMTSNGTPLPLDESSYFRPWGATRACGAFARFVEEDPAAVDAFFASVHGARATVVDVESALRRGVDLLASEGLSMNEGEEIADADAAFAYLVAAKIVDEVWLEVVGSRLTIATHFPRNRAQRDVLQNLTDRFVASHFSLQELLADVVTSPWANLPAPAAADGACVSFPFAAVLNPWSREEPLEEDRGNGPSDAVHALSARTLLSAAHAALDWPAPADARFPAEDSEELAFQQGLGVFTGPAEKGFRGLDFQARLVFESRFGTCSKPPGVDEDAVDAIASSSASLREAVAKLRERFTNEQNVDDPDDEELLQEQLGDLDGAAEEGAVRFFCGVLLASPQFQLRGIPP